MQRRTKLDGTSYSKSSSMTSMSLLSGPSYRCKLIAPPSERRRYSWRESKLDMHVRIPIRPRVTVDLKRKPFVQYISAPVRRYKIGQTDRMPNRHCRQPSDAYFITRDRTVDRSMEMTSLNASKLTRNADQMLDRQV